MSIEAVKIELVQLLLKESRESVLEKVKQLLEQNPSESNFEKAYNEAQSDKESGNVIPHDVVKEKYEKWL